MASCRKRLAAAADFNGYASCRRPGKNGNKTRAAGARLIPKKGGRNAKNKLSKVASHGFGSVIIIFFDVF